MNKNKGKKLQKQAYRHWMVDYNVARQHLSQRFVGNDDAIQKLAGQYATYSKLLTMDTELPAPRLFQTGPVSSGKTSSISELAKLLKVPFVTMSLASLTPEGYRGSNLSSGIKALISQAGSIERLEAYGGVIFLDECCKLALKKVDPLYESLIYGLYGLLGAETIHIDGDEFETTGSQLNTKKIMVVLSGAFAWVPENNFSDSTKAIKTLLRLGYPPEFCSRLTDHVHMKKISQKQIQTVIEIESKKISECFRAGKYTPSLSDTNIKKISKEVLSNQLGIRSAKRLISEQLYAQAKNNKELTI